MHTYTPTRTDTYTCVLQNNCAVWQVGYDEVGLGHILERIGAEGVVTSKCFQLAHKMGTLKYKPMKR